jgi:SAM-dependent methyltransferase
MVETFLLPLGPRLVEACGIKPGMKVLDVAAGTGNASLVAAATGADVVATDLTPELLEAGEKRAAAAGLSLTWEVADAENLPYETGSFDVVMSSIGAMFAPIHQQTARELVRVCRPGGTIGMINWTPDGVIGDLFRTIKPFAPAPPPGALPPPLWGNEEHVTELFGGRVQFRTLERDVLDVVAFPEPGEYVAHFRAHYGPTIAAEKNALADGRREDLVQALLDFEKRSNVGTQDAARYGLEYLVVVATRR